MTAFNPQACEYQVVVGYPMAGRAMYSYEVEGYCVSDMFAVNNDLATVDGTDVGYDASRWTVTHIPTGYALITGLPTKKVAVAVAERFGELGYGSAATEPKAAAKEMEAQGLLDFKAWLIAEVTTGRKGRELEGLIAKWPKVPSPRPKRAAKRAPRKKKAPPKKAAKRAPKKPPKKPPKKAKKPKERKKPAKPPEKPLDLLAMAKKIRGENPSPLTPEQARRKDECLW